MGDLVVEHHEGLREAFLRRAISPRTMAPELRAITVMAIAQLVATAAFIAIRRLPEPHIVVAHDLKHAEIGVPITLFIACVIFLSVSWAYILTGALHSHPLVRLASLAFFTYAMLPIAQVGYAIPLLGYAVLGLFWVWAVVTIVHDRGHAQRGAHHRTHRHHLNALTFAVVLGLTLAFYGIPATTDAILGNNNFALAVHGQLIGLTFVLIPLLFLAGTDFAEWGEIGGGRVAFAAVSRSQSLAAILTAGVAIVAAVIIVAIIGLSGLTSQVVLGLLALLAIAILVLLADTGRGWNAPVPLIALAAGTVLALGWDLGGQGLLVLLQGPSTVNHTDLGTLEIFTSTKPPKFSIEHPPRWHEGHERIGTDGELVRFYATKPDVSPQFLVVNEPLAEPRTAPVGDTLPGAVKALGYTDIGSARQTSHQGWQIWTFAADAPKGGRVRGQVWWRTEGGGEWTLIGDSPPTTAGTTLPAYQVMTDSWSTALPDRGVLYNTIVDLRVNFDWVPWLLVGLVAAALLVRRGRRGIGGPVTAMLLFLAVASIIRVVDRAAPGTSFAFGRETPLFNGLTVEGTLLAVAIVTLGAVAWALLSRAGRRVSTATISSLLAANLGLLLILGIVALYNRAIDASGTLSLVQAGFILVALTWDIVMSGRNITNTHGSWFPRQSRVLMFFGYILLVAAAVLFFSSQFELVSGLRAEPLFDSELWPAVGVATLGVPLLLCVLALNLARLRPGARSEAPRD